MQNPDSIPARCFGPSGWSVLERSPIDELYTSAEDWDGGMARLGWAEFSRIGRATVDGSGEDCPFRMLILHRPDTCDGGPRFLIELSGNIGECDEFAFVQDLPSLMALLESWAPVLQAGALTHLAARSASVGG